MGDLPSKVPVATVIDFLKENKSNGKIENSGLDFLLESIKSYKETRELEKSLLNKYNVYEQIAYELMEIRNNRYDMPCVEIHLLIIERRLKILSELIFKEVK